MPYLKSAMAQDCMRLRSEDGIHVMSNRHASWTWAGWLQRIDQRHRCVGYIVYLYIAGRWSQVPRDNDQALQLSSLRKIIYMDMRTRFSGHWCTTTVKPRMMVLALLIEKAFGESVLYCHIRRDMIRGRIQGFKMQYVCWKRGCYSYQGGQTATLLLP